MSATIDAFPLSWPEGWPRHAGTREWGSFKGTPGAIRDELVKEVDRLVLGKQASGYTVQESIIISSNIPVRRDGLPMANAKEPADPGIAVYFERSGKRMCFACDKYDRTWKNMRAIQKSIEALRGIERWGSSDMMERAFTGFAALPAPGARKWWEVMGVPAHTPTAEVKAKHRELARIAHPDAGGHHDQFTALANAWADFQKERGLA